ncbi:MAG: sugar ABC transporter ATP-binding protein [Chloroflexi bacterium]|nr:MAG: sugar ABC transporter ATP-binding protein [Chloroflexota bacterium]
MTAHASLEQPSKPVAKSSPVPIRLRNLLSHLGWHLVLIFFGILLIAPLVWLVSTSLKEPGAIFVLPPRWIPNPVRWQNYPEALTAQPFLRFFLNTLNITFFATLGTVVTASMAAYGFARLRFPLRSFWFGVVISTLMLPSIVTLIPTFILFRWLRWIDTFYPLIVPYWFGGGAFFIFLLRQFFLTVPLELDEAARIDGASNYRIYWQIILPLAKPALATVIIFSIINHWNEFVLPLIYLHSTDKWTMAIGLQGFSDLYSTQWHWLMAASTVMVAPLIILFFSAQRYYLEGIHMSGLAGR